ncbi:helix-turn-helix domain-containing protein [Blastococcus sp. KM273129]|uniref:helix-turn-helix domain-containing protein n=1 Tax=Blastococcus sp. KM273129 TaxID=2570315 RepID=UPI001F359225|nr:helix-turn-helix domain-containing protein [Blastococcus sp. KM273129]MCF6733765.1 ArsR family transcriptional regulator [Blastococcus sp. KM273129]
MNSVDLLLHPVRLRVVQAFLGDRTLTTGELRSALPDVPVASLYRHVGVLADAGVLEVVGERKVRGASERSYRLVLEAADVPADDLNALSAEDHRRAFTAFVAALLADFDRYLDRGAPDLARDGAGYRQVGLWLTDEEFAGFLADLRALFQRRLSNRPGDGRRRRLVGLVNLPGDDA